MLVIFLYMEVLLFSNQKVPCWSCGGTKPTSYKNAQHQYQLRCWSTKAPILSVFIKRYLIRVMPMRQGRAYLYKNLWRGNQFKHAVWHNEMPNSWVFLFLQKNSKSPQIMVARVCTFGLIKRIIGLVTQPFFLVHLNKDDHSKKPSKNSEKRLMTLTCLSLTVKPF